MRYSSGYTGLLITAISEFFPVVWSTHRIGSFSSTGAVYQRRSISQETSHLLRSKAHPNQRLRSLDSGDQPLPLLLRHLRNVSLVPNTVEDPRIAIQAAIISAAYSPDEGY
jgi:hypothetical protein